MRTFKFLSIILLGLVSCVGNHRGEMRDPSSMIKNMSDSTVALVFQASDGIVKDSKYSVYCTGVWISSNEILTAHHCVQGAANMAGGIDDEDEKNYIDPMDMSINYIVENEVAGVGEQPTSVHFGKVVAVDELHDLAIVKDVGKVVVEHKVAELADIGPGVGESIFVVGHVKGLYWSHIRGTVAAYRGNVSGVDKMGPFLQLSAPVYFGNSGGGVFDEDGKLVGIVSFMVRAPLTNFAIELKSIDKMIKEYRLPALKVIK